MEKILKYCQEDNEEKLEQYLNKQEENELKKNKKKKNNNLKKEIKEEEEEELKINMKDNDGDTLLIICSASNSLNCLQLLLNKGAKVNLQNKVILFYIFIMF